MTTDMKGTIHFPVAIFAANGVVQQIVMFLVDTGCGKTAIPKNLITNTRTSVGKVRMQDMSANIDDTLLYPQTLRVRTRDDGFVKLVDFPIIESNVDIPIMGTDLLQLFNYRIVNDKLYLIGLKTSQPEDTT